MARIAIVDVSHLAYEYNFGALGSLLVEAGHEVMAVYASCEPPRDPAVKHGRCHWESTAFLPLVKFSPDFVVVFNGSHPHRYAATIVFESMWRVVYAENGWLPQGDNMYLDTRGVNSRSSLMLDFKGHPAHTPDYLADRDKTIMALQKEFRPDKPDVPLPENYILVPLQLEQDTSIIHDSPYFKSMRTFVHYVMWHFGDHPVVVKPHPKDPTDWRFSGIHVVDKSVKMNDLVPGAKLVIGINSTTLIEALVHHKPVVALGRNVATGKGVYVGEPDEMIYPVPRVSLDRQPDKESIDDTLHLLAHTQFPRKKPPVRVLKYFEV